MLLPRTRKKLARNIWNKNVSVAVKYTCVWVNYAFSSRNTLSHFGIDSFQLVPTDNGWKIFTITDTRRKSGFKISEILKKKYH